MHSPSINAGLLARFQILRFAAWVATALGNSDEAKNLFSSAIGFEIYRLSLEGKLWPEGATALELLCGLSRACKKTGDLGEATEALKSALPLSDELYGDGSGIFVTLVSFLKSISEKQETMLRHHKAVVIASTDLSIKRATDKDVRSAKDVNEDHRWMELHAATSSGNTDIVRRRLLTLPGADKNAKNSSGETFLHHAAQQGHEDVVRLLVTEFGADKNVQNSSGETPLHYAVMGNKESIVRLLVAGLGAEVAAKNNHGCTPLHVAAGWDHQGIVSLLIELGADTHAENDLGKTPLDFAIERGYKATTMLLE